MDFAVIEKKWQQKWEEKKIFEANPDSRKKFFSTFPYPYINGYPHIGHLFTIMRVEAFSRFKRHQGYNVLFPQGWHATGSPIVNAAKRVAEKEEKQIKIMRDTGFSDSEIGKFSKPEYWIDFFAPVFEKEYKMLGLGIDWRRTFYTTALNPHYNKFIEWQFRKLKEKNYVIKGKFPVVWDPIQKIAVGDHDRVEGEGETPQEFCLFKFKLEDGRYIVTATLRPDTSLGITNVYVNPEEKYVEAKVNTEKWIIGKPVIKKLEMQEFGIEIIKEIEGISLVGKDVETFSGNKIPVLPASFLDINYGTGMVHSVPSDSADDLIALRNLQSDEKTLSKYNLDPEKIKSIKPIPIFDTPEIGNIPAEYFLNKYQVESQNERDKLENIKKELYTLTFNQAKFNEKYEKAFSINLKGKLVKDGQETIKRELLKSGAIHIFYELTGKVVSRALSECCVKIVNDQWFIDYNNPEWKNLAHKALDRIKLYPEKSRQQFNYVIDWLHEWACTREEGLGTRLPWDNKWLIESLSDSTVYMAYYTISHLIKDAPIEAVNDELFEYIFTGKGDKPNVPNIDEMRQSFEYYYPVDFRNSGKDLIQNHLTFYIFNHVAIFEESNWPAGIGVNGWVTVDGKKMSKSLGNVIPIHDIVRNFGADIGRITILNGGEELDDPNWDSEFAKSFKGKIENFYEFAISNYKKHSRIEKLQVDLWFESELNRIIKDATNAMESTKFRTAIQIIFFELQNLIKRYSARTKENFHSEIIDKYISTQLILLSPFIPHMTEEIWNKIGEKGFISLAPWPIADESKIDDKLSIKENYIDTISSDIKTVQKLAKLEKIEKITIVLSQSWKYKLFRILDSEFKAGNRDFKSILSKILSTELKTLGQEITKMLPNLLNKGIIDLPKEEELKLLSESLGLLEEDFSAKITVLEESDLPKAKQAMPGKPAIIVE
jgi:leucyl-tRNA synthetase